MSLTSGSFGQKQVSPYGKVLIDALSPFAEIKKIAARRNLYLSINQVLYCYLLLEGEFGIYRKSDHRMLAIVSSPTILGITGLVTANTSIYMKALVPAVAGRVPLEVVQHTIQEQNLWETLSRHLMLLADRLYVSAEQLSAPTAFDMVCTQLTELMREHDDIRENITAERYIRDKTELSRSRIMHILSELKKSGHIDIQKGILLSVGTLPADPHRDATVHD